mmetsp:Transcript_31970/g.37265  ORF Transcript_31970/g.37265 Transcript_31970/m.37265 type:complete len:415 (+) Transcript_31970:1758-3002(+)
MVRYSLNILALLLFFSATALGQDTLDIEPIEINKKKFRFKKSGLYEGEFQEEYNIRGFTQLSLFERNLVDFWTSESKSCIEGKLAAKESEQNVLKVNWNSDQGGCDWVGMGFGWDGWKSKDLGYVLDTLALELIVRSTGESFTNIPWAFCLEDYSEAQAWVGYKTSFLKSESITKDWTKVEIPLSLFPFDEFEVDASNIKQLLIQVFAEGIIEIKSITLVPFNGKLRKETPAAMNSVQVDGDLSEWNQDFNAVKDHKFAVSHDGDHLFFAFDVFDPTPRVNAQDGSNLWNGDAIEVAFSTNTKADRKRKFLLLSDQHLGINCGENSYVWNWKTSEKMDFPVAFSLTENGYQVELAIPTSAFRNFNLQDMENLDMEVAFDLGNGDTRKEQLRWNSENQTGFHESPSLWGGLILSE